MAEEGDENEEVETGPVDGSGLLEGTVSLHTPLVEEPEGGGDDGGFEGDAEEGVGEAAVVLECGDGSFDGPKDIDVREAGGDGHGSGGVGGFAVEAGAGEDGSGHEVG